MLVSDMFYIAPHYDVCPYCDKSYPDMDKYFRRIFVTNDKSKSKKVTYGRIVQVCKNCYQHRKTDSEFDDKITEFLISGNYGMLASVPNEER